MTSASFLLDVGVFLKGIPHPMSAKFAGVAGQPANDSSSCHFRFRVTPNRLLAGIRPQGFWYVGAFGFLMSVAISNATSRLSRKVLPWFETFADPRELLRVADARSCDGKYGRVKDEDIRSPNLVLGLLADHLEEWEIAKRRLSAARALKDPRYSLDRKAPEFLYSTELQRIDSAIDRADRMIADSDG